ncbi:MAG: hypothetical protein OQJ89_10485, partial [Kangiellaceae bacterium]|nr:hypothetical protein [Kangiellaceae bacterium]
MKIRRFYGINVRTALKQVTDEFGEDAAILSNKKVPGGVEVIAALDYDESLMPETMISDSSAAADPQTEIGTGVEETNARELLNRAAELYRASDTLDGVAQAQYELALLDIDQEIYA